MATLGGFVATGKELTIWKSKGECYPQEENASNENEPTEL